MKWGNVSMLIFPIIAHSNFTLGACKKVRLDLRLLNIFRNYKFLIFGWVWYSNGRQATRFGRKISTFNIVGVQNFKYREDVLSNLILPPHPTCNQVGSVIKYEIMNRWNIELIWSHNSHKLMYQLCCEKPMSQLVRVQN